MTLTELHYIVAATCGTRIQTCSFFFSSGGLLKLLMKLACAPPANDADRSDAA